MYTGHYDRTGCSRSCDANFTEEVHFEEQMMKGRLSNNARPKRLLESRHVDKCVGGVLVFHVLAAMPTTEIRSSSSRA